MIAVEKQGRHRYHRLASPEAARLTESVMQIAGGITLRGSPRRVGPKDAALREARTCYDHLAGALGVSIADALRTSGAVEIAADAAALTEIGRARTQDLGVLAPDTQSARLPPLSGLERAPPSSRRRLGGCHRRSCIGSGLGPAPHRNTRAGVHTCGQDRLHRGLRG